MRSLIFWRFFPLLQIVIYQKWFQYSVDVGMLQNIKFKIFWFFGRKIGPAYFLSGLESFKRISNFVLMKDI